MRLVRAGALIYMDVEAANRLLYYLDIAYNELADDEEQSENCLLGCMLQDVIAHQEDYQDPRLYAPDPSDFWPDTICCDPPEVLPDGT